MKKIAIGSLVVLLGYVVLLLIFPTIDNDILDVLLSIGAVLPLMFILVAIYFSFAIFKFIFALTKDDKLGQKQAQYILIWSFLTLLIVVLLWGWINLFIGHESLLVPPVSVPETASL